METITFHRWIPHKKMRTKAEISLRFTLALAGADIEQATSSLQRDSCGSGWVLTASAPRKTPKDGAQA